MSSPTFISSVELIPLARPLPGPFRPAWSPGQARTVHSAVMVRLHTRDGHVGVGATVGFAGGDALAGAASELRARLVGLDLFDDPAWNDHLQGLAMFAISRPWFVDIARWDLIGRVLNQPLWRLLGGATNRVRTYASTGELKSPDERVRDAKVLVNSGFPALKLRFHSANVETDFEVLSAVRSAVGDDIDICVDANQGWKLYPGISPWNVNQALSVARRLAESGAHWLEEPLQRHNVDGLSMLRSASPVPIAGGEMSIAPHEIALLMERNCLDIFQPDAVFAGGISGIRDVLPSIRRRGLRFSPHSWSNGIGLVANLHLAAAAGTEEYFEYPIDPGVWEPEFRDFMLAESIGVDADGWICAPDGPGLGVTIDEESVEEFRTDR